MLTAEGRRPALVGRLAVRLGLVAHAAGLVGERQGRRDRGVRQRLRRRILGRAHDGGGAERVVCAVADGHARPAARSVAGFRRPLGAAQRTRRLRTCAACPRRRPRVPAARSRVVASVRGCVVQSLPTRRSLWCVSARCLATTLRLCSAPLASGACVSHVRRSASVPGLGSPLPTSTEGLGSPLPTSAPGLDSCLHICTRTGLRLPRLLARRLAPGCGWLGSARLGSRRVVHAASCASWRCRFQVV